MKKVISCLAILSLVAISVLLIYQEAFAIDLPCDTAEIWCEECPDSDFEIIYCWEGEQQTYCEFMCDWDGICYHWYYRHHVPPVFEICTL